MLTTIFYFLIGLAKPEVVQIMALKDNIGIKIIFKAGEGEIKSYRVSLMHKNIEHYFKVFLKPETGREYCQHFFNLESNMPYSVNITVASESEETVYKCSDEILTCKY